VHVAGARPGLAAMMILELHAGWGKPGDGECRYYWNNKYGTVEPKATPCKTP
jgi:hypothetical protein